MNIIIYGAGSNPQIAQLITNIFNAKGGTQNKNLFLESSSININDILLSKADISIADNKNAAKILYDNMPKLDNDVKDEALEKVTKQSLDKLKYPIYKIFEINDALTYANNELEIIEQIKNSINFMREEHEMLRCLAVNIDASQFRSYISAIKILLLCNRYGIEKARTMLDSVSVESIIPHAFEPLEYLDTLTRISPFAVSLMLSRYEGAKWHFYNDSIVVFKDRWLLNAYFSEYISSGTAPAATTSVDHAEIFGKCMSNIKSNDIKAYLELMIFAINNMFKYFLNPSNFSNKSESFDIYKMIVALSTIKLIFADLKETNYSVAIHSRSSLSLSSLDKIANLIKHMKITKDEEPQIFSKLFLLKHRDLLLNIYKTSIKNPFLLQIFNNMLNTCYQNILTSTCQSDYENAADVIRSLRNLKHGAALKNKQYDRLFFTNNIHIPEAVTIIPLLTILGISLNPEQYLTNFN